MEEKKGSICGFAAKFREEMRMDLAPPPLFFLSDWLCLSVSSLRSNVCFLFLPQAAMALPSSLFCRRKRRKTSRGKNHPSPSHLTVIVILYNDGDGIEKEAGKRF